MTDKIPQSFPGDPEVNLELAESHQLTKEEYDNICDILGRKPTFTELGIYSVMWSEHASYKNSIAQLKTLPRDGDQMLVGAGEENAGLVDIGDNLAVAFKIESHNHPSAVEPFQGAATGVGGILRDIFTMGARPIASLNSLHFGDPEDPRVRFIYGGVIKGIAHYGNCFGVPTVAGEAIFEKSYQGNPLINVMAVGIVKHDQVMHAIAEGVGNPVIYVGARTGRDGIHGATFASEELSDESEARKSNVQVGDPFAEKLLLEATLELSKSEALVGIQDMGAAGLTCSSSEMAAKSKVGMLLDLDKVPRREENMNPYEILLSESQERMLLVAKRGRENEVFEIFKRWDLEAVEVGEVSGDGKLKIVQDGILVADIPAATLALGEGAPVYNREFKIPEYIKNPKDISDLKEPEDFSKTTLDLLARPNIASKQEIYRQYDHMVRNNTRLLPGLGDAAVIRVPSTSKALGVCTDCNGRYVYLNPRRGAAMAVAEAARNIACVGTKPVGITNCLNFGNPYKEEVFWTFKEAVAGMGEACRVLNTPVTGGNVSFYNESPKGAVFPTPTIGMLGVAENLENTIGMTFPKAGQAIFLLGPDDVSWAGSEWQMMLQGIPQGELANLDLELEKRIQDFLLESIEKKQVIAAHDLSEGGLMISLAEMAVADKANQMGALLEMEEVTARKLFAEGPSRIVVVVDVDSMDEFEESAEKKHIPIEWIGTTGGNGIGFRNVFSVSIEEMSEAYFSGLTRALGITAEQFQKSYKSEG